MTRSVFFLQLFVIPALSLCIGNKTAGQPGEAPMASYTNPVVRGFNPDPSICRVGQDYYMITSSSYLYPGVPINGWWHHTAALGHADFIMDHSGNWWAVCLGQQYALFITMRGGQKFAILRKISGDMVTESSPVWITSARVLLRISFDTKTYHFSIAEHQGNWKEAGTGMANMVSTDLAGTFGGVVIGPYATGNGTPCQNPADFDWVEYNFKKIELSGL